MLEPDNQSKRENSKSLRKRQMLALQDIGKILVELPSVQLAKIPLEPALADAIETARHLKSNEAKRRQLQYIGRLMRTVDIAPVEAALNKILHKDKTSKAQFHQIERWRDRLIAEGDSVLQELLTQYPQADSQYLRQLTRKAQKDIKDNKASGADTLLFRYLRDICNNIDSE